jgi:hypothetical protein
MKTLADLRRRLVIGARLETLDAPPGVMVAGNAGASFLASRLEPGQVRTVFTVQSNGVSLQAPDGHRSFLDFPKAAELRFEDEDTFTVLDDSDPRCNRTYRFVKES